MLSTLTARGFKLQKEKALLHSGRQSKVKLLPTIPMSHTFEPQKPFINKNKEGMLN